MKSETKGSQMLLNNFLLSFEKSFSLVANLLKQYYKLIETGELDIINCSVLMIINEHLKKIRTRCGILWHWKNR